jgi:phage shock protein A
MGVFGRIWVALCSLTGAILAPAPDPRDTFASAHQRQRELLDGVRRALDEMTAAKAWLQTKTAEVETKLPQLHEQARLALRSGREDLARNALQRRQVALVELRSLTGQIGDVEQEEQRLTLVEQRLSTHIEAFFARQEVLAARYTALEVHVRINEALGGVTKEIADLGTALEHAEQRTEHMQARAAALDELVASGALDVPLREGDDVDRQLDDADVARAVDEQLAAMRQQLGIAAHEAPSSHRDSPPSEGQHLS